MVHLERKGKDGLWGVVEAIYKLKYFIFVDKNHRKNCKNTGQTQGLWVLIGAWQPWCLNSLFDFKFVVTA